MELKHLTNKFERMGAHLEIRDMETPRWGNVPEPGRYTLDVVEEPKRERFVLEVRRPIRNLLDFHVVDVRPKDRHLLLVARELGARTVSKFLCGHDERHWFVAAVQSAGVTRVADAMDVLKPDRVVQKQLQEGVRRKNWHKRKNKGFIRQGEWFFIPMPDFEPDPEVYINRNEPLTRDWRSKPHVVEEVIRFGGTRVYVHKFSGEVKREAAYARWLREHPGDKGRWDLRFQNPRIFARGKVRHKDHKTLVLRVWHEVLISREASSSKVVFYD